MNRTVAEALLLGAYVSCFVWTVSVMLKELFPSGLGAIFRKPRKKMLFRVMAPACTLMLSLLTLLYSLRICRTLRARSIADELVDLMILLLLAISPWASYQLIKLLLKLLPGRLSPWKDRTRGEIVMLVILYFAFLIGLLVTKRVIRI
jgi:hypothetical protein